MKTPRPRALGSGIFVLILGLVWGCFLTGCELPGQKLQQAPDFTLPSLDPSKEPVTLSEFVQSSPVLLVFWATWCPACVEEIEQLNEWESAYPDTELRILSVNVGEDAATIEVFLKDYPIHYPVLLDRNSEVTESYDLMGLPVSLFLANNREILYYGFGLPSNLDKLLRQVKESSV